MTVAKGKFYSLLESLPHPAFLIKDNDLIEAMNSKAIALTTDYRSPTTGKTDTNSGGKLFGDLFPQLEDELAAFSQGAMFHNKVECILDNQDGSIFEAEFCSLLSNEGLPSGIIVTLMDITKRRKIEEALHESERRYRLLANNVTDVIWTMDRNMAFTFVSPSVQRLRGYTAEEVMAQSLDETLCPGSFQIAADAFAKEMKWEETGNGEATETMTLELEQQCKDGGSVWTEVTMNAIRDHSGRLREIVGITRDISKRRQAEDTLRNSEEEYRRLVEFGTDIIYRTDNFGYFTYINPAAERFIGLSQDEILGRRYLDIIRPDYRDIIRKPLEKQFKDRIHNTYSEFPAIGADGREIWIAQNVQLITEGDRVVGFQAVARDITKRKKTEDALQKAYGEMEARVEERTAELSKANEELSRENEERRETEEALRLLSTAVEQSGEGLAVCDMDWHILFINKAFAEMHGYSKEEATGRHISIFHSEKQLKIIKSVHDEVIETGGFYGEVDHMHRDGSEFPSDMHVTLLKDGYGEPVGMVASLKDITDSKRAHKKEQRYIRELEFLSRSATDFMELPFVEDIYQFIGKKLIEVVDEAFISIGSFSEETNELKVRVLSDHDHRESTIRAILGATPSGITVKITDEAVENLKSGRLDKIPGGIFSLMPGVPEETCRILDEKFGPADLYAMGFSWGDRLFGNIVIYLPEGEELKNRGIIETFVRLASVALQRRSAQEELSKERDLVALIMEMSPVGIMLIDSKGQVNFANKLVKDKLKISDSRLINRRYNSSEWKFTDLDGNPIEIDNTKQVQLLANGKAAYNLRFTVSLPDGERTMVSVNASPITDSAGEVDGVILTLVDISDRIKAERALRESERRYRLLAENSSDVIWTSGPNGHFTYISPSVEAMTGYTFEEALKIPPDEILVPESMAFLRKVISDELTKPADELSPSRIFELQQYIKDGSIIDIEVSMTWLAGDDGKPAGLQGSARQITKRKQAARALEKAHKNLAAKAAELEEANAELAQYAYVVSHDMKAPLRAIHNYADFLSEDLEDSIGDDQKKYLAGLKLAVRQGEELVEDLLMLSRIGRRRRAVESIDMKEFFGNLISYLEVPADVEIQIQDDWPLIEADQTLLRQIFQNLISNAIKFNCSERKLVELGSMPAGPDHYEFFVRDNGIGLAIVKKAVSKLGGAVRIESKPEEGSAFFIFLPKGQEMKNG